MKAHSFSKTLADAHGVNAAIVLKLMAHKTRRSTNIRDDIQWYYGTLDELSEKLPYLGRSTIDDALKQLAANGLLEIGNYNKYSYDRTRWFHVPEQHWGAAEHQRISFHAAEAEMHGVTAAVLMWNLEYWLKRKLRSGGFTHSMNAVALAEALPFKASTIKSTLSRLVKDGALIKVPGKKSEFAFPPDRMRTLRTNAILP